MSLEDIDAELPPLENDRTRLYLGLRTVTGVTRVLVCHLSGLRAGDEDVRLLAHPSFPGALPDNYYDWGPDRRCSRLAVALLEDACGPVACARLWVAFHQAVVQYLPDDAWELSEARIQTWASRRLLAGREQ